MEKKDLLEKLEGFIREVNQEYPIELGYLFGSFAKETPNKESDIDLAVLFQEKYQEKKELLVRGTIIDMGMKYFQRKLDVVSLNRATPLLKYEIIRTGILLKDSSERASFESLALREYFDFRRYSEIYNKAIVDYYRKEN